MKASAPAHHSFSLRTEAGHYENNNIERPLDLPDASEDLDVPEDPYDLDDFDFYELDDDDWDVFLTDDDEPLPDRGDFWNDEFPNDE